MINTYAPKFTGYDGEKFEIQNIINQVNYYTVKCLFYTGDQTPAIKIDFRVREDKKSLKFLVFDIVAEGISLIETQRSEFGSTISNSGFDKFASDLESKIKTLKAEPKS
jgi:phospholipid transport system substrate-binding protein